MYSLDRFTTSPWSLVVYHGKRVAFRSQASDLRPLVRYLADRKPHPTEVTVFDKYVGRAAAMLMLLADVSRVYTVLLSDAGAHMLEKHGVPYQARRRVTYLMGAASDEMCRWEKFSLDKTPQQLLEELTRVYKIRRSSE